MKIAVSEWPDREKVLHRQLQSGLAAVVNVKTDHCLVAWAKEQGLFVYVGRYVRGWGSSKWGNPYIVGRDGTRDECCDRYEREHLPSRPDLRDAITTLRGKALGCFCSPHRCHGDSLARLANREAADSPRPASPRPDAAPASGAAAGRVGVRTERVGELRPSYTSISSAPPKSAKEKPAAGGAKSKRKG